MQQINQRVVVLAVCQSLLAKQGLDIVLLSDIYDKQTVAGAMASAWKPSVSVMMVSRYIAIMNQLWYA